LQSALSDLALVGDVQTVPGLGRWSDPLPSPVLSSFTAEAIIFEQLGRGFPTEPLRQGVTMRAPYGVDLQDNCQTCPHSRNELGFCSLPPISLSELSAVGNTSVFPDGAVLFMEGQMPRGVFILCSGKVKLTTTSRNGKILILKMAEAGDVLGLSAVISNSPCELTAETVEACQLKFVERETMLRFLKRNGEAGLRCAQALSREFQSAYEDIHELVMSRSSAGRLARLLLSWSPPPGNDTEVRIDSGLTHEEMAQMIGSSRETVTRLISDLKRKRLIRTEGSILVIRNRDALEQMAA
jgi:CRP/FNR family transcriptional regulator